MRRNVTTQCKWVSATLSFLFVIACGANGNRAQEQAESDTTRTQPKSIEQLAAEVGSQQSARQASDVEGRRIAQFPGHVHRLSDSILVITPLEGDSIALFDVWDEENLHFAKYSFIGNVSRPDVLIIERATGYDTFEYLLAWASTGDTLTVDQPPVFSPSGSRFITASACIEMSVCPLRIQLFKEEAGDFVLEQTINTAPWGAVDPEWIDEKSVLFKKRESVVPDPYDLESPRYRDSEGELRLVNGVWQVTAVEH